MSHSPKKPSPDVGFWSLADYRNPTHIQLPRRVNHASATYKNKIYLLGGYHKLDPDVSHENLKSPVDFKTLDCYEFDTITMKTRQVKKPEKLKFEDLQLSDKAPISVRRKLDEYKKNGNQVVKTEKKKKKEKSRLSEEEKMREIIKKRQRIRDLERIVGEMPENFPFAEIMGTSSNGSHREVGLGRIFLPGVIKD